MDDTQIRWRQYLSRLPDFFWISASASLTENDISSTSREAAIGTAMIRQDSSPVDSGKPVHRHRQKYVNAEVVDSIHRF